MIEYRQVGEYRLRVAYDRQGAGTPLVICNGWGSNLEVFDDLAAAMAGRPVLRFDVPGIGGSERPALPLRLPQLAELVEALRREYRLDRVDVFGYSWGGTLAQELARRNPRMVRRLVLAATSPGHLMVPARPRILRAFADPGWVTNWIRPRRFFEREFICRVGPLLFGGQRLRRNPMAILPLLRKLEQPSTRAMAWQVAGAVGWTSLPWLHRLTQPTLVLAGDDDRVINPLNPMLLAWRIPDARLQWVSGGHLFPVLDAVDTTAEHMRRFLDERAKVVPFTGRQTRQATG
jgi:poly(3-hydroxyalkanoate) depolymerase